VGQPIQRETVKRPMPKQREIVILLVWAALYLLVIPHVFNNVRAFRLVRAGDGMDNPADAVPKFHKAAQLATEPDLKKYASLSEEAATFMVRSGIHSRHHPTTTETWLTSVKWWFSMRPEAVDIMAKSLWNISLPTKIYEKYRGQDLLYNAVRFGTCVAGIIALFIGAKKTSAITN
jgi:hypothetical protein